MSVDADDHEQIWRAWLLAAQGLDASFAGCYRFGSFDYQQPLSLQSGVPRRMRRPYSTPVFYTDWGPQDAPLLLCCGGVANTAMRFSFVAADLSRYANQPWRVICMDWLGRGRSGWLADEQEYRRATYVEQMRQMIAHLGGRPLAVLGSSMGGTVAVELAARQPGLISRLILNDVGPQMPRARRQYRAETLARFYVFRSPGDIMRRVGAAQKNDGPVSDEIRHFLAWHQTRWSDENAGRIYRVDPRALQAYRAEANQALAQWDSFRALQCPLLLLHGMDSDALQAATLGRMQRLQDLTLAHIPATGHTPMLSDRRQIQVIAAWLRGELPEPCEFSIPLAKARAAW
ncbi:alpha/beta fold hydrolase [Roseateles oligotrophus]|uniref:Alpha/beta hydrolase n=1 Tax=Roseateles oligotrophus TaxID=1769250 RepID=A0ABT2YD37_9BURK|nr:alpha/beta hydrolase [Roseateles oligotrophus]MCV2367936.1 alpha/beta hydrolase [Roseateles oligotrophus]